MDPRYMVLIGIIMFYSNTLRSKGVPDKIIAKSIRNIYNNIDEPTSKIYDRIMQGYLKKIMEYNAKHGVPEKDALKDFESCIEAAVPSTLF